MAIQLPRAAEIPALRAAPGPERRGCRIGRTRGSRAAQSFSTAQVASEEQSSTTTTSMSGSVCASAEPMASPTNSAAW
jgi:hypothetical protein